MFWFIFWIVAIIFVFFLAVVGFLTVLDEVDTIIRRNNRLAARKPTTSEEKALIDQRYHEVINNAQTVQFMPLPKQRTQVLPKVKDR